ncbi:MAG: hypothetical protein JWN00_3478 [Actinomycetia bacterium]|nr:hypothetical protein [Actinomycetes bacterium]
MTRTRKVGAVLLAAPLAMGFSILAMPGSANASTSITAPRDGAVIRSGSQITASAHIDPFLGVPLYGKLTVSGAAAPGAASGWTNISLAIDISHNGRYNLTLSGGASASSHFTVAIPPASPSGLSATKSGSKVTVSWNRGTELDLTGYRVSAGGSSGGGSVAKLCPSSSCSIPINTGTATGSLRISVTALRSNGSGGTIASSAASTSVSLGSGGNGSGGGGGGGNNNLTPPGGNTNTNTTPTNPQSQLNLPNVAPNTEFNYPTPTPEVLKSQLAGKALQDSQVSAVQWGRSIAIALILLIAAAHLGTWTRRVRIAQTGILISRGPKGNGKARVRSAQASIAQAEALAKTGTLDKSTILGDEDDAPGKRSRFGRKGRSKDALFAAGSDESGELAGSAEEMSPDATYDATYNATYADDLEFAPVDWSGGGTPDVEDGTPASTPSDTAGAGATGWVEGYEPVFGSVSAGPDPTAILRTVAESAARNTADRTEPRFGGTAVDVVIAQADARKGRRGRRRRTK